MGTLDAETGFENYYVIREKHQKNDCSMVPEKEHRSFMEKMENKTLGLVLSGGGYRGFAHVGALKAMDELGIKPDYISGTSAGAILGALYAAGHTWEDCLNFFKTTQVFSLRKYALGKPGVIDSDKFYDLFRKYFQEDSFESLNLPLFIATTDLIESRTKYFHEGPLIMPLLASAAVPGVFSPVEMNDRVYCDGGVTNNFPTEPLQTFCDYIIGIYVNPLDRIEKKDLSSAIAVTERAYYIIRAKESERKFNDCDVVIAPKGLLQYPMLSNKSQDTIFEIGYQETKLQLESFITSDVL